MFAAGILFDTSQFIVLASRISLHNLQRQTTNSAMDSVRGSFRHAVGIAVTTRRKSLNPLSKSKVQHISANARPSQKVKQIILIALIVAIILLTHLIC